jgi:hypothetical protein
MTPPATPDALADLRGYHLPEAVSWWPPAPGWWLLGALLLLATVILVLALRRRRRRRAALRAALGELERLGGVHAGSDPAARARRLSQLLRRYALARYPRHEVAGLTGEDWLRFLDAHGGGQAFTHGAGRLLSEVPYRPVGDAAALAELAGLARSWILHNAEKRT